MEPMHGRPWQTALADEASHLTAVCNIEPIRKTAREFADVLRRAEKEADAVDLDKDPIAEMSSAANHESFDISDEGYVGVYTSRNGSEFFTAGFWPGPVSSSQLERSPHWTIDIVGSPVAVIGQCVYYTRCDPRTNRDYAVESVDLLTGRHKKTLFSVKEDVRAIIQLVRCEGRALFFTVEHSGTTVLYWIEPGSERATLLDDKSYAQVPLGVCSGSGSGSGSGCAVWIARHLDGHQEFCCSGSGSGKCSHSYPSLAPKSILPIRTGSLQNRWIIGNRFGKEVLYCWISGGSGSGSKSQELKALDSSDAGEFHYDEAAAWSQPCRTSVQPFIIKSLASPPRRILLDNGLLAGGIDALATEREPIYHIQHGNATSADGTHVPFLIASGSAGPTKPKALLVYGYGFYGQQVPMSKLRTAYAPLLEQGWAVAFAFIRGGGEGGDAWAAAGRLYGRQRTIEDFEAVLLTARGRLSIPPERTVITGRSAAGALLGALVARHPAGEMFKGVYAEVPFVDGLRTQLNTSYPMTTVEQDEYGDPARSLTDFMTVFSISATNRVPDCGVPNILVLARTAENDSQVLPYESLKWIWRLRGPRGMQPWKLFAYEKGQGHFYDPEAAVAARSADMAVIHNWIMDQVVRQKMLRLSIKMAERKNNSVMTRKNRKTRKNNTNAATNMMGGKRRKAGSKSRKSSRKSLKTSRKVNRKH